jgi:hypothetical protein
MVTDTLSTARDGSNEEQAPLALIAYFDGDWRELSDRFRMAASCYAEEVNAPHPQSSFLMRNKDGIVVVLVWPEGVGIKAFQKFLRGSLEEFGLPHPRVEHLRADPIAWSTPSIG